MKTILIFSCLLLAACNHKVQAAECKDPNNSKNIFKVVGVLNKDDVLIIKINDEEVIHEKLKISGNNPNSFVSGAYKESMITGSCHRDFSSMISTTCDISIHTDKSECNVKFVF